MLIPVLIVALAAGCVQQHGSTRVRLVGTKQSTPPFGEAEVLEVARQAHATMTVHPARYRVHGLTAERHGTNWTVSVWLLDPGSGSPLIADWSADGEAFQISGDGKVISYEPSLFP